MEYESINSSPDTLRINNKEFDFNVGKAFTFLDEETLLWTYSTHNYILNAMKKASAELISKEYTLKTLQEYEVKHFGEITAEKTLGWRKMIHNLDYYSLAKIRQATNSGRIWKNIMLGDDKKDKKTCISFWTDQRNITKNQLDLLVEAFKVENEILWEGTDSRDFISFTPGQKEETKPKEVRKLKSAIAPNMSHEELLNILMRAHYDAMMSPFERRIARELQGMDAATLKTHTGGYPTTAEYNYRSKFSEAFMPLLNQSSSFDAAIKQYMEAFKI